MTTNKRVYRHHRTQPADRPNQVHTDGIGAFEGEACVHADAVLMHGFPMPTVHRVIDALNDRGAEDTARIDGLRKLCGYVEDGSASYITISLDDATKAFTVSIGPRQARMWSYGEGFREAIDAAITEHEKRERAYAEGNDEPRPAVVAAIAAKITEACMPADVSNMGEISELSDLVPSDGAIYAEVSRKRADAAEHQLQDAEDTLRALAREPQPEYGQVEEPAIPHWAQVRESDNRFVNVATGLDLGNEFEIKWGHRKNEFARYDEHAFTPAPDQTRPFADDERGKGFDADAKGWSAP